MEPHVFEYLEAQFRSSGSSGFESPVRLYGAIPPGWPDELQPPLIGVLNALGRLGWEVVAFSENDMPEGWSTETALLKRMVSQAPPPPPPGDSFPASG